jgi:hypothetical protein
MRLQAVRAKFDVGSIISSMLGMVTGGGGFNPLSIFFSIIKNLFSRKILCIIIFKRLIFSLPNVLLSWNGHIIKISTIITF